jgi:hypothetical protein
MAIIMADVIVETDNYLSLHDLLRNAQPRQGRVRFTLASESRTMLQSSTT